MGDAARTTLPLTVFLVVAMWLVRIAERKGIAERLARALAHRARTSAWRLYALVCLLTAALTALVSLDGAVVVMLPVLIALTRGQGHLLKPLAFGTVGVANAFSLALPEGNPTNLVVMARLQLTPGEYLQHLFLPGLAATAFCVCAVAAAERSTLRGSVLPVQGARPDPASSLPIPWTALAQIAVLVTALGVFADDVRVSPGDSVGWIVLIAVGAGVIACVANNLPASALLASLLGSPGLPAYAVMTGLSVGALATPRGSVATLIVREGTPGRASAGHLSFWLPVTLLATALAAVVLGLVG